MGLTWLGRYELLERIAAGGMAEIYRARHRGDAGFEREVAIKRLFRHLAEDPQVLRLFHNEARLLARLTHPGIPHIYEAGQADGSWFMALEYISGWSLKSLYDAARERGTPLPVAVTLGIMIQVCAALDHVHRREDAEGRPLGIVHRDVNPHNIMISHDGIAKVLDFGIARTSTEQETDPGALRGTYAYMAPEQVRGQALDHRADVFALGILLYELTTGQRLFDGPDVQVMMRIVEEEIVPPSCLVPGFASELESIVMQALERDPARRMSSARHLAVSLQQYAVQRSLVVTPWTVGGFSRRLMAERPQGRDSSRASDVRELTTDTRPSQSAKQSPQRAGAGDRLGLDRFGHDDIRPVVLLKPTRAAEPAERRFMTELERRLEEDAD